MRKQKLNEIADMVVQEIRADLSKDPHGRSEMAIKLAVREVERVLRDRRRWGNLGGQNPPEAAVGARVR